ncbi:MAG: Hint domain-containing protein [Cognatishimia sp.]
MTWVGLSDHKSHALGGLPTIGGILERGTLMLETRVAPQAKPQPIVGLELRGTRDCSLSLQAMPGGGIHFLLRQDTQILHAALAHDAEDQADILRISYAWDLSKSTGHLVIERPGTHKVFRREFTNPLPLSADCIKHLITPSGRRLMCEDVVYVAVSDQVEPIGPMPALCPTTPIQTPYGLKPAGKLKRGDLVVTLNGDTVPVLHTLRHTVPARGSFEPVRLRAPYFGLQQDIVVTQEARLVVGGTQVEYLFGSESVLVPVKHLTTGGSARIEEGHKLVSYVQLLLPDHEPILAGGTAIESLSIGRIRRKRDLIPATLLSQFDPLTIPEHSKTAFPVLKHFEAVTLAHHRAA